MAKQLQATVVTNNGGTLIQSFSVDEIWVQESTTVSGVNAIIWLGVSYNPVQQVKVQETISELATLAGSGMIQATVLQINSGGGTNFQALFSSNSSAIGRVTNSSTINSFIIFNGIRYSCSETQSSLVAAANAGGGGGGGGLELEIYQNSAMSSAVMAYVYRDESDNIYGVYEPIRNNKVFRSQFAYADSIDLFPFDNADWFNDAIKDVKLIGIAADAEIQDCTLETMVINAGNHTGIKIKDHHQSGTYGIGTGHGAEIHIIGDNVRFEHNAGAMGSEIDDGDFPTYFDSVGAGAYIYNNIFTSTCEFDFNGSTNITFYGNVFLTSTYIPFSGLLDTVILTGNTFNNISYLQINVGNISILYNTFETGANIIAEHDLHMCDFGVKSFYTSAGAKTNANFINIAGTTYELGISGSNVTATPV